MTLRLLALAIVFYLPAHAFTGATLPATYDESHDAFEALATGAQAQDRSVSYFKIAIERGNAPETRPANIQILYAPPKARAKKLIVLSSGIHGVEAPAGSFLVQSFLRTCLPRMNRADAGVLLIHNMNPHGFKEGRRFNRNNVDLNRNCFDYRRPFPSNAYQNNAYTRLRRVFEVNFLYSSPFWLGFHIAKTGVLSESDVSASLSGQYESPRGIYYGGRAVETECRETQKVLEDVGAAFESALHLDIHTGLGKYGINQIMMDQSASNEDQARFERLFPDPSGALYEVVRSTGTDGTLVTHGDFTQSLCALAPNLKPCLAATAEIGALPGLPTLMAIINENATYHNPTRLASQRRQTVQALRDTFSPLHDERWVDQVVRNSAPICEAALRFIDQP